MSVAPTPSTVKRLFAVSGNRCAFPRCAQPLVHAGKVTGRVCHIKAASPQGPRYDPSQAEVERHGFENLLLLCPIHHDVVDADPQAYTVERLVRMKAEHEQRSGDAGLLNEDTARQFLTYISNVQTQGGPVVITNNQTGGIAAHTVNISAPIARRLTVDQKAKIALALRRHELGRVEIEIPLTSGADAVNLADDIAAALRAAGWVVREPILSTRAPVSPGIEVVQRHRGVATPAMHALTEAFGSAAVPFTPLFDSTQTLAENTLGVYIGPPI